MSIARTSIYHSGGRTRQGLKFKASSKLKMPSDERRRAAPGPRGEAPPHRGPQGKSRARAPGRHLPKSRVRGANPRSYVDGCSRRSPRRRRQRTSFTPNGTQPPPRRRRPRPRGAASIRRKAVTPRPRRRPNHMKTSTRLPRPSTVGGGKFRTGAPNRSVRQRGKKTLTFTKSRKNPWTSRHYQVEQNPSRNVSASATSSTLFCTCQCRDTRELPVPTSLHLTDDPYVPSSGARASPSYRRPEAFVASSPSIRV